jgi:hypothetical protein
LSSIVTLTDMSDKITMSWTHWLGHEVTREVNLVADARNVVGLAGYPWIVIAANPHLSNADIGRYLATCGIDGVERSLSWIQRHRWMFRRSANENGAKSNLDGNYARALQIMWDHPTASNCELVRILKEHRIKRSREWVRKHRCDPLD